MLIITHTLCIILDLLNTALEQEEYLRNTVESLQKVWCSLYRSKMPTMCWLLYTACYVLDWLLFILLSHSTLYKSYLLIWSTWNKCTLNRAALLSKESSWHGKAHCIKRKSVLSLCQDCTKPGCMSLAAIQLFTTIFSVGTWTTYVYHYYCWCSNSSNCAGLI